MEKAAETQIPSESEVISGGPALGAPVQQELPLETKKEPLYVGFNGELNSVEDLKTYARQIETKFVEANAKIQSQIAPAVTMASTVQANSGSPTEKLEDPALLIYHDPARALKIHREQILEEVKKQDQQKQIQEQFWKDLYEESPDLRSVDPIVKSTMTAKWNEIAPLSIPDARKFLAKESRKMVDLVKTQFGVRSTEMPSGNAVNLGASGQPAPRIPVATEKPKSLAEQLSEMRKSRRQAALK